MYFLQKEIEYKSLFKTIQLSVKNKKITFGKEISISNLLEEKAVTIPEKPFIHFYNNTITFDQMDKKSNQVANYLEQFGLGPGCGMAIMMENSPEFLYPFFASQKLGMYCVPINISLVGDGLKYILNHCEAKILITNEVLLESINPILNSLKYIKKIFVLANEKNNNAQSELIKPFVNYKELFQGDNNKKPSWRSNPDDISTIMYTSGTTGLPKGVVYRYGRNYVRKSDMLARLMYNKNDILYTCLPLFHANALFLSLTAALGWGISLSISKKFSASKFWSEIAMYKATSFNALGAMIPILLKQSVTEDEKNNTVRLVGSAACPSQHWMEFEKRFSLKIWEAYSAVDSGGHGFMNYGTAPVGSIGKAIFGTKYRIIDDDGNDVDINVPGELIFEDKNKVSKVEFYMDENATNEKNKDGYIYTGDLVYKDINGYLYFVGRKTENMRRRGENISAYEIENVILKHPRIMECAAYGVPSELGEEDIMVSIVLVPGKTIKVEELSEWLIGRLAKYAIPQYYRILSELPKTETYRVKKNILKKEGVTPDTIDLEKR